MQQAMTEPPPAPQEDLEAAVRGADSDRWLASRFIAEPGRRADVIALYAFDHVLGRVPHQVSEPLMGEIRLTWWSEALDEIYGSGPVRAHPAALALADVVRNRGLARSPLDALVEARFGDLRPEPFAGAEAALAYADQTAGALAQAAAQALGAAPNLQAAKLAGRAYGLSLLARRRAIGGQTRLPLGLDVRPLVHDALRQAAPGLKALPLEAFPAVAYAALARRYAAGGGPTTLEKQLRLVWATAAGRV
jgi:phytoene synthase